MNCKIEIIPRLLHFKQPAGTSRGTYTTRKVWYLHFTSPDFPGRVGIGECAPLPALSCDDLPDYEDILKRFCRQVEKEQGMWDKDVLCQYPSILFGLETAIWHFFAGSWALSDTAFSRGEVGIQINGLIWMGDFDHMLSQIEKKMEAGFRCVKLKIGAIDFEKELALLRHIRTHFSSKEIELRVDANGAFSPVDAMEKLKRLSEFDLHSIEQPICAGQWEEMARLAAESPLAIALDEELIGCNTLERKQELLSTIRPQYIVIKPSLHGGICGGDEWITEQSVSQPQLGDDGLTTVTLTYTLSGATDTRGGLVRITNTNNTLASDIAVVQKDPDVELVSIPDQNLRALVVKNNWALSIAGSQCIILEAGLNATSLSNSSYSSQLTDLTGIENFPNLTSLSLGYCTNMKKLDISGLHKVKSLSLSNARYCEEYNLGDNPIPSFNAGGTYAYSYAESLKFSSSKLESLDLSIISWYESYDNVTSIDVSECPMLTTLNANRSNKVKTLYLKKGQEIPNLTKNDATTIVYK